VLGSGDKSVFDVSEFSWDGFTAVYVLAESATKVGRNMTLRMVCKA